MYTDEEEIGCDFLGGMSYLCYGLIVLFCKFRVLLFGIITLVHDYVIILI